MNYPETDDFIKKLDELPKQDFMDSLFPSNKSIFESEQALDHGRIDREKLLQHPFYRQNYNIVLNFISNLINDNLYHPFENSNLDELYDVALKTQTRVVHNDFCTKLESFNDDVDCAWLCSSYQKIFEQTCTSSFKYFANKIKNKEIISCTNALSTISKYDENMEIILSPFNPHIRNSISHNDWYYNKKKNVFVFDDLDKPTLEISSVELSDLCKEMLINEDCFFSADFTITENHVEENLRDSKSVLELLDFFNGDSESTLKILLSKGYPIKNIKIVLECYLRDNLPKN